MLRLTAGTSPEGVLQQMTIRFLIGAALLTSSCATAQTSTMPRTSDNVVGWPACGKVSTFPTANWDAPATLRSNWNDSVLVEANGVFANSGAAAMVVLHRGELVASWGSVATPYTAQSVRKGLVSSLAGLLIEDGKLSLDKTLEEFGIDDDPVLSENERQATFEHLLMSRSGIMHSALYEVGGWKRLRAKLAERKLDKGGFRPGEYWVYNNWDFNAIGTVLEQAGETSLGEQFAARIAGTIGMQDFRSEHVEYTTRDHLAEQHFNNQSDHRAYVFNISTRDLARYGLLYLNCGSWDGQQVVPRHWVLASLNGIDTRLGRSDDQRRTGFGDYGYLWQIDRPGSRRYPGLLTREPIYFATGNRGHLLMVAPYLDLVVAVQPATEGGVAPEAQRRRAIEGSPEIEFGDMTSLLSAIIHAHPQASEAFIDSKD